MSHADGMQLAAHVAKWMEPAAAPSQHTKTEERTLETPSARGRAKRAFFCESSDRETPSVFFVDNALHK